MATSFKKSRAWTATFIALNPEAGHHQWTICWRLLNTTRQVWVSLLWGPCSFFLGPGAQGPVCALQESTSQSCANSGSSVVGLMVTSKRAYAMPGSAAPRAPAPWQSTADPYLHRRRSQFSLSLCGVPGSWCTQGLFEPSESLWRERGLILNANPPLLPSCWGFCFALGREYLLTAGPAPTVWREISPHSATQPPLLTLNMAYLHFIYHVFINNCFKLSFNPSIICF